MKCLEIKEGGQSEAANRRRTENPMPYPLLKKAIDNNPQTIH
jgi:hypothetical protein